MKNESEETMVAEAITVSEPVSVVADAITAAEVDVAIATAKKFPRDPLKAMDDMMTMAILDDTTAADCFYSLRREGKTIQGGSVRLAEIAISCWGNVRAGARILGESADRKFVRAQGICHDLEKNVYVSVESQRRITKRDGARYSEDMIGTTANAAASIALRNATFRVIPKAIIMPAYERALEVATGKAKTMQEKREEVIGRLMSLNPLITLPRILTAVECSSADEIPLKGITHLIGLGTAVKDGELTIEEAFPEPEGPPPGTEQPVQQQPDESKAQAAVRAAKQKEAGGKAGEDIASDIEAELGGELSEDDKAAILEEERKSAGQPPGLASVTIDAGDLQRLMRLAKSAGVEWSDVEAFCLREFQHKKFDDIPLYEFSRFLKEIDRLAGRATDVFEK